MPRESGKNPLSIREIVYKKMKNTGISRPPNENLTLPLQNFSINISRSPPLSPFSCISLAGWTLKADELSRANL